MKRRILSFLMAFLMICTLLPAAASAEAGSAGVLSYNTTDDGEAVITGCDNSASGKIVIPDTLGGCPVTAIDSWVFALHKEITEIVIPDSVTEIGEYAFYLCEELKRVVMSKNVTAIHDGVFWGCFELSSLNLPDGITEFGERAFFYCKSLNLDHLPSALTTIHSHAIVETKTETLVLPNTLSTLEAFAFTSNPLLKSISFPSSIQSLPESLLDGCGALKTVTLPEKLTEISDNAFHSCQSLSKITIPAAVTKIGAGAFGSCYITIRFSGQAPAISESAFNESQVLCVYPSGDTTWTSAAKVNGGANQIIWTESNPEPVKDTARSTTEKRIALKSNNHQLQNYDGNFLRQQCSNLYVDGEYITRAEHTMPYADQSAESALVVEQYNSAGKLLWKKTIADELPVWGGFYAGKDYYFLVYGLRNDAEDDSAEVIRVVRYSKNWNRIDAVSIRGVNTVDPFDFGSIRMTQNGNFLYIHTCRIMYRSPDGARHQSSLSINIYIPEMKAFQIEPSYVSHSFNQFVTAEYDDVAFLDHGDAYPRALQITRFPDAAGSFCNHCDASSVIPICGEIGDNYTGMQVGGFAESETSYISAGLSREQIENGNKFENLFVAVTDKTKFGEEGGTAVQWLTNYTESSGVSVSNPRLVKISADRFLLLWCEATNPAFTKAKTTLHYLFLNGRGEKDGEVYSSAGIPLSDCQPIVSNNSVVWYVTEDSVPVFYRIKLGQPDTVSIQKATDDAPAATPTPVPSADPGELEPAVEPVSEPTAEPPVETPVGPTPVPSSKPTAAPTAKPSPVPSAKPTAKTNVGGFSDVWSTDYYADPVDWAVKNKITAGTSKTTFSPAATCTRAQTVTFLWRAAGSPEPKGVKNPFKDIKSSDYFYKAVLWAVKEEITAGTSKTTFSPNATVTRGQTVTFLWRSEGEPAAGGSNPFKDVKTSDYYYNAVLWAAKTGVTAGTDSTHFSPKNGCTRGQIVTFLYRDLTS